MPMIELLVRTPYVFDDHDSMAPIVEAVKLPVGAPGKLYCVALMAIGNQYVALVEILSELTFTVCVFDRYVLLANEKLAPDPSDTAVINPFAVLDPPDVILFAEA